MKLQLLRPLIKIEVEIFTEHRVKAPEHRLLIRHNTSVHGLKRMDGEQIVSSSVICRRFAAVSKTQSSPEIKEKITSQRRWKGERKEEFLPQLFKAALIRGREKGKFTRILINCKRKNIEPGTVSGHCDYYQIITPFWVPIFIDPPLVLVVVGGRPATLGPEQTET